MIKLSQVSFEYGPDFPPVLSNINLELRPGEKVAIMGPNGSGKSTLARLMAGLTQPASGEVSLDFGRDQDGPIKSGFLFQNPDNQMVAMTVAREVAFALENRAIPLAQMKPMVAGMLGCLGIADLADRLTSELSGGEKQRVALAASMIYNPPVLILDEPDSFLDADGRRLLSQSLQELSDENRDLIIVRVTQYERVARRYQRLIVLEAGEIVADGSPETVLATRPQPVSILSDSFDYGLLQNNYLPASSRPVRIVLDQARFGYPGSAPLCDPLDLSLSRGETVGLFGPTGSGKSSLGYVLCGLMGLSSGKMTIHLEDGRETEKIVPGSIAGVMQMPERQFFLPTCAEEIAFGPKNRGKPLIDSQVDQFFDLVGLDPIRFANRDPLTLSVGEKRRLAFAAILSMSPSFIIFDEPTASLDSEGLARFTALTRQLRKIGLGQVIISHERAIITGLTDRTYCLPGDGSLLERPDSSRIDEQILTRFLAD